MTNFFPRLGLRPSHRATQTTRPSSAFGWLTGSLLLALPPGLAQAQLSVTGTSPATGARAAAAGGPVSATFNQTLASSSTAALKVFGTQRGGLRSGSSGTTTVNGSTVSFAPTGYTLQPGETVQATVTTAATGTSGSKLAKSRVWQFTAAAGQGPGTFNNGSDPVVGAAPRSVAVGDVDGDGDLDLLTANSSGSSVSVRLNDGKGNFTGGSDPSVGSSPVSVVLGDLDGDGDLDLLTANSSSSTASVRLNDGKGNFSGNTDYYLGSNNPQSVALGDVDGDGDLDLLAAGTANFGNTVGVRLNDGKGYFGGNQRNYPDAEVGVGSSPVSVVVGDVDGDGDLDLLTANQAGNSVSVRLNDGTGIFSGSQDVGVGSSPVSVAVGDVDGDGDLDLLAANSSGKSVSVRFNNGSGTFSGTQNVGVGSYTQSVAVGDVDGDGDLDLLAANANDNTVSVRLNDGKGNFAGGTNPAVGTNPSSAGTSPFSVALGDVDGDGDLDLLAANYVPNASGNYTVSVRLNQLPLLVTSTSPANGARAAAAGGPVSAIFNQTIASSSTAALKVFSTQRGGLRSGRSGTTTVSGNTVSFAPTGYTLQPGETVQATVTTAATAAASVPLAISKVWQFTVAAGQGPGTFGGGSDPAVGTSPRSVAVGDVDGDGDLDLLTANSSANSVSVRLNNGSGTFTGTQNVGMGRNPQSVVLGDVDGDGDLDLLTASYDDSSVSLRFNNGTGSFSGSSEFYLGSNPQSVTLGDVDGDGDLDLLAADRSDTFGGTVGVRLNDGKGNFSDGQRSFEDANASVGYSPASVVVGDVDGDGDLDLLTANQADNTVSVRLNDGTGIFSGSQDVGVGSAPTSVAVGDVDGDGDLDLLAANSGSGTVSVRLNNGSGTFSGGSNPAVGSAPQSVVLGDVDGDGDLDLLAANASGNSVSVRLNDGKGNFTGSSNPGVGSGPQSVTVGDVDGDGDLDLLTANQLGNSVSVRINQLPLVLTSTSPANGARAAAAGGPVSVTFNQPLASTSTTALKVFSAQRGGLRSGRSGTTTVSGNTVSFAPTGYTLQPGETVQATVTTAATATAGGTLAASKVWQFTVAAGKGLGTFGGGSTPTVGGGPQSVAVGDVDGDGDLDLLTANQLSSLVSVRLNDGKGNFAGGSNPAVGTNPSSTSTSPYSVVLGDVDGDGDLDLLTANLGDNTVSVRLNNGSGTFSGTQNVGVGTSPYCVAVGDVDGDGDLDLLTANLGANSVSVRLNDGAGTFSGTQNVPVGNTPFSVAVGDVDGDGDLDMLAANTNGGTVSLRLNDGKGNFSGTQNLTIGSPTSVALGDVDGDGDLDLLAANRNGNVVSVRLNDGQGAFSGTQNVDVNSGPQSVALGDVDGDGDLDLLTANSGANTVSVRLNDGRGTFASGSDPAVGGSPYFVTVGDVDGDGDLDLLAANADDATVSVRLNQNPPPTLTALSPAAELPGQAVTLTGTGFTSSSTVSFGTTMASITSVSATSLTVLVPAGLPAGSAPVSVSTGGTTTAAQAFAVLAVYDGGTLNACAAAVPATASVGDGAWHYLLSSTGQVVAAYNYSGTSLGTLTLDALRADPTQPVRQDANKRYYLGRNWHLTASAGRFDGRTVGLRLYGLNTEQARLQVADPTATLTNLKATQYSGPNEDCQLGNNRSTGESRVLTAPATSPSGTSYFVAELAVADHFSEFYLTSSSAPLPVELTAFTATPTGPAAVRLAWATASEKNSTSFEVERSLDGRAFASLGTLAAAGNSSTPRAYELLDAQLPAGAPLLYYRLRQVDQDGTFSYSPVRTVALTGVAAGLALFPNPTRGGVATLTGAQPGAPVTVLDALGRRVLAAPADAAGTAVLALPTGLASGVYVVRTGGQALRLMVE